MAQHTNPWSSARYPDLAESTNLPPFFENIVDDYAPSSCPIFTSTSTRNTAFANWLAAGNTAKSGMRCFTQADGRYWRYNTGTSSWLYAGGNPPPITAMTGFTAQWNTHPSAGAGFYTDASGLIHGVGTVQNVFTFTPDGSQLIATLPAAFRPAANLAFLMPCNQAEGMVEAELHSDGTMWTERDGSLSILAGSSFWLTHLVFHPGWTNGAFA